MRTIPILLIAGFVASAALADDRVDRLTPEHRKWLEEEVVYIITDKEREVFLSLDTVEERDRLIEAFWLRRDPDRTTSVNEFKEEHYRRLEYANETFSRQTTRAGWQTDQGRIYIILGPPREREKFEAHYNLAYCELWTYQAPPNTILPPFFHLLFFKEFDVGEYELYSPLADGPLKLIRGVDRFTVDPMVAVSELLDISPNLAHASLTYDMSDTPDFATGQPSLGSEIIVARISDVPRRSIDTGYIDAWLRYGGRISSEYTFNFIPSRSVFSVLVGPDGVPFVHYRIEVDPQNFRLVSEADGSKYYTTLDVSLAVVDGDARPVLEQNKDIYLELTPEEIEQFNASPFAYEDDFPLIPGDYNVSVILRNRAATQYTVAERDVSLSAFSPKEPALSDVVLGYETELASGDAANGELRTFQVGSDRVYPAADGIFFVGETAYAFFQVLGASLGQTLSFALSSDEGSVFERTAAVEGLDGPVVEAFPLKDVHSGRYQLRVELLDASSTKLAERVATLNVSARNPLPRAWVHSRSFDTRVPGALALAVGSQFQAVGKQEQAARALAVAIRANPENAEARWRLAGIHLGWREPDEALALLLPLEEGYGERYEVAAGLGFAFYMKDEIESAARYLEKAVAIRPPTAGLLNALADCHAKLGNTAEARRLLERSLELDPEQQSVRDKLATMGG